MWDGGKWVLQFVRAILNGREGCVKDETLLFAEYLSQAFQWGGSQWAAVNCHFRELKWESKLDKTVRLTSASINFGGSVHPNGRFVKSVRSPLRIAGWNFVARWSYYGSDFNSGAFGCVACCFPPLAPADARLPFGWQLALNKRLCSGTQGTISRQRVSDSSYLLHNDTTRASAVELAELWSRRVDAHKQDHQRARVLTVSLTHVRDNELVIYKTGQTGPLTDEY